MAEKEPENGVFRLLRSDVTRFLTTILIGTTYFPFINLTFMNTIPLTYGSFLILDSLFIFSVVNIGATALVTEAATAIFGEAGVSAATGVMTVCTIFSLAYLKNHLCPEYENNCRWFRL